MKKLLSLVMFIFASSSFLLAQTDCVQGDCLNGHGTTVYPSGAKYTGDFVDGKIQGKGIFYFSDGNKYIGHWENQKRHGKGRFIFTSGDEYFGMFQQNKFHGNGVMTYANGSVYEGQWLNNKQEGQGTFIFSNGDKFIGLFLNGLFHGTGTMSYADGSRYEGEWKDNKRDGQGIMTYPDGKSVAGRWKSDEYVADWNTLSFDGDTTYLRNCNENFCASGPGKFYYKDNSKFVGQFVNGLPEGQGTMYYKTGDRYEGGWKQHAPHGEGVMYYKTGKTIGAIWDKGKPIKKLFSEQSTNTPVHVEVEQDKDVKIWAVVIGAARYNHMPVLRYTDDDAYQLYAFLKSPEGGALPDNQVSLLIDEDATRNNILTAVRSVFLRADENDVVLFYFSGHGLEGSFLPINYDGFNNKLEHTELIDLLKASRAKHKIILADACHSGSMLASRAPLSETLKRYYAAFEASEGGTALFMSSKGEEYSLEDGGLRSGIFSHFLVKGLKGDADTNHNKIITIDELFNYVHNKVRAYTGNIQTPTLSGRFDKRMPIGVLRD